MINPVEFTRTPVADLLPGELFTTSRRVESWQPEFEDDDQIAWAEQFDYADDKGTIWRLCNAGGRVASVYINGVSYDPDDWTRAIEDYEPDSEEDLFPLSYREWQSLFDVRPAEHGSEGPRMSAIHPCERADLHEAYNLLGLPVCLVSVDGGNGFALTGGGTDLTWELVEAYTRFDMLPPVSLARSLPTLDRGTSDLDRYLTDACLESLRRAATLLVWERQQLTERAAMWQAD